MKDILRLDSAPGFEGLASAAAEPRRSVGGLSCGRVGLGGGVGDCLGVWRRRRRSHEGRSVGSSGIVLGLAAASAAVKPRESVGELSSGCFGLGGGVCGSLEVWWRRRRRLGRSSVGGGEATRVGRRALPGLYWAWRRRRRRLGGSGVVGGRAMRVGRRAFPGLCWAWRRRQRRLGGSGVVGGEATRVGGRGVLGVSQGPRRESSRPTNFECIEKESVMRSR